MAETPPFKPSQKSIENVKQQGSVAAVKGGTQARSPFEIHF
jgi:hypothetical protein